MKNFSYTKTPELSEKLRDVEELRRDLLLKPLSPRTEMNFQWQSLIRLIHFSLTIVGTVVSEEQIQKLLSPEGKKQLNPRDKEVIAYKRGLDYLYHNWLVNDEQVNALSIVALYNEVFDGALKSSESDINNALSYIQINPEHPLIQAALGQLIILDLYPFSKHNELFSHLVFLMFLYKNGYDFRRMVVIEELFYKDLVSFNNLISKMRRQANVTEWLEYVASNFVSQLRNVIKAVSYEKQFLTHSTHNIQLHERQQQILDYLSQPNIRINNTAVQKMFKISQITASRDLSKLTSLGLVFPLGRGRSTYYTKV